MDELKLTLEDHKMIESAAVIRSANNLRSRVLIGTTKSQREVWPTKGRVANNVVRLGRVNAAIETHAEALNGAGIYDAIKAIMQHLVLPEEIAPLGAEVQARGLGETEKDLALKQFDKAKSYVMIDNMIEGMTHNMLEMVDKCKSIEALEKLSLSNRLEWDALASQI